MDTSHLSPNLTQDFDTEKQPNLQNKLIYPMLNGDSKLLLLPNSNNLGSNSISKDTFSLGTDAKENSISNAPDENNESLKRNRELQANPTFPSSSNMNNSQIVISPLIPKEKDLTSDLTQDDNSLLECQKNILTNIKNGIKNDYDFIKLLDRNLYGELFLGIRKCDKVSANIQTVDKTSKMELTNIRKKISERFMVHIMYEFPLVQKLFDVYEDSDMFYVCSESLDLHSLLDNIVNDIFKENEIQYIVTSLLTIIEYSSKYSIDLNCLPNICLDKIQYKRNEERITIKLGDNGIFLFEDMNIHVSKMINQVVFYSPERAKYDVRTVNSDIWAVAMLTCVILIGKFPFLFTGVKKMLSFLKGYLFKEADLNSTSWNLYSPLARQFICNCLKEQNGNITKLLNDEWLTNKSNFSNEEEIENSKLIQKKFGLKAIMKTHISIFTYIIYNLRLNVYINNLKIQFQALDFNCNGKILISDAEKLLSATHFYSEDVKIALERVISNEKREIFYLELIGRLIEQVLEELEVQILKLMENVSNYFNYNGIPSELYFQLMQGDFTNYNTEMPSLIFNLDISKKDHIYELEFIRALKSFCRVSAISLLPIKK